MKYFKPKSVTWWSGLVLVIVPVAKFLGVEISEHAVSLVTDLATGTGLVGLRGAATKLLQG